MKTKIIFLFVVLALFSAYMSLKDNKTFNRLLPADATLPDNSKYFGDLKDGLFDGQGQWVWADGSRYIGHFESGLMNGLGELYDIKGTNYTGSFKEGMMHGFGKIIYADGMEYQGDFKHNNISGSGVMRYPDGRSFEGVFDKGVLIKGVHTDAEGNSYDGTFEGWLLKGYGTFTSKRGDTYTGMFEKGILNGQGRITTSLGSRYEGEVLNWRYQGTGNFIDQEGNQYQGEFEDGEFHGEGILKLVEPIDGISEITGHWEYGYNADDPRYKQSARVYTQPVDSLLYSQNNLLNVSLSEVSSSKVAVNSKDKIDMYFFGMAAHHESVFYQEIEYIEKYFNNELNTEGKSVTLFNHPSKSNEKPLVTNQSIVVTMAGLAEKMDVENDVLFFYLTSHGNKEKIAVSYPGLQLSDINAEHLGELIKNSPIKWKVIVISACYSGSFIPFLEDEHHLVMTAAREDRVSFGCGEGSDMTYFAKAMFIEALPLNSTFVAAFEAAKLVITQWENEDFPESEHSEPQIFIGSKIENHLKKWRAQIK